MEDKNKVSVSTSRSRDGLETYPRSRLGLGLGLDRLLGSRAQAIISATTKQQQYCGKQNVCILHNIKKILNNIGDTFSLLCFDLVFEVFATQYSIQYLLDKKTVTMRLEKETERKNESRA